mgnify:CR=1 FL=1
MIITRTPLRISIGGGGTDLPSYYRRRGGYLISAAINRYIYIAINDTFTDGYVIKYSALERADAVDDIEHPLVREALRLHPIGDAKEIVSIADIPRARWPRNEAGVDDKGNQHDRDDEKDPPTSAHKCS